MRFVESRAIIWALGEIGTDDAIPQLTLCLSESFRPVDALIALGKIGNIGTIGLIVPYILKGVGEARSMALRSLSMILEKYSDIADGVEELRMSLAQMLRTIVLEDEDRTSRFYAMLCLARIGEKMDQAQVRQALDMSISKDQMSSFQSFFMRGQKKNK